MKGEGAQHVRKAGTFFVIVGVHCFQVAVVGVVHSNEKILWFKTMSS